MSRAFDLFKRLDQQSRFTREGGPRLSPAAEPSPLPAVDPSRPELTKLVRQLYLASGAPEPRVLVFADVAPASEGNWVCANASELLAGVRRGTVCMVEANPYKTSSREATGTPVPLGLTDLIEDGKLSVESALGQTPGGDLWVMTRGSGSPLVPKLAHFERLRQRMNELRARFDYVLIDSPPVQENGDALALGQAADGVVLVVRTRSASRDSAARCKSALDAAGVAVIGAVLIEQPLPVPDVVRKFVAADGSHSALNTAP